LLFIFVHTGKDRTGLIAMLTLHIVGASDEEIIADYVLSDSAYRDIKDSKAMVVAMKQVFQSHNIS
jgi:protein tyrosine/serine phosphatase